MNRVLRLLSVCVALLATSASAAEASSPGRIAAWVNEDAVSEREFVEAMRRLRFRHERLPALREAALADCVQAKVLQQLARTHELVANISDEALRAAWRADNARRAGEAAQGQPVYGPKRLDWEPFRSTWFDRVERELVETLAVKAGAESKEALLQFYRENPARFTAPGAESPLPFADIRGHVIDVLRRVRYEHALRAAVAAAKIRPDRAVIDTLEP